MVCGPVEGDPADPSRATITNPALVSQSHPRVEHYRRLATGGWEYHDATEGVVQLASGAVLDLARLYAQLPD